MARKTKHKKKFKHQHKAKTKKHQKKKPTLKLVPTTDRTELQKELIQDSIDLVNDTTCDEISGYLIVAFYKDGYNSRAEVPDDMTSRLFGAYSKEIIDEHIQESAEDEYE